MAGTLGRLSAAAFHPLRQLAGPLHRRKHRALSDEQVELEEEAQPLGRPWSDDSRWYRRDYPPHAHNHLEPLPHGSNYFARLCDDLLQAKQRVTIAGWALTPLMALLRGSAQRDSVLAEVLRDVSGRVDVYVLVWSGAPALFEPNTHAAEEARRTLLDIAPKVRYVLDHRAKFSHDHHQKAVTIDGRSAYVGGIDLSTFQGDRWDTRQHPLRFGPGWHDIQVRIEGECVRDVESNFCERWNACTNENIHPLNPEPAEGTTHPAQIVRTVPRGFYPEFAPEGRYGIRHALLTAIERAEKYIYLENQYLWAPEIFDALCDAMDRHRGNEFRVLIVLPAKAYSGRYDNDEHVRKLRTSDPDNTMFQAYSLYAGGPAAGTTGHRYLPIYVHAKVAIIDDEWLLIGSANLNRRGLGTDTEIAVQAVAPEIARSLRADLWSEHLALDPASIEAANPTLLIDTEWKWRSKQLEQARRLGVVSPGIHAHPYIPGGTPQSRLMDRFQSMTLEH